MAFPADMVAFALPATPTPRDALPPPASVSVPTPAQSPEFPAALGASVSRLAADGIQRAELHLNPAEMGPISVQIVLEGTQARVEFGADSSSTRQLIEAGLPELAAALREAGLTLSGGGVSQHAPDPRGQSGFSQGDPQRGGQTRHAQTKTGSADKPDLAARTVRPRAPAGRVDLYA